MCSFIISSTKPPVTLLWPLKTHTTDFNIYYIIWGIKRPKYKVQTSPKIKTISSSQVETIASSLFKWTIDRTTSGCSWPIKNNPKTFVTKTGNITPTHAVRASRANHNHVSKHSLNTILFPTIREAVDNVADERRSQSQCQGTASVQLLWDRTAPLRGWNKVERGWIDAFNSQQPHEESDCRQFQWSLLKMPSRGERQKKNERELLKLLRLGWLLIC